MSMSVSVMMCLLMSHVCTLTSQLWLVGVVGVWMVGVVFRGMWVMGVAVLGGMWLWFVVVSGGSGLGRGRGFGVEGD